MFRTTIIKERPPGVAREPVAVKMAADHKVVGWVLLGLLLVVVVRNAWVTEDAYIMFRTIDQFLAGNGLVWNMGERVQVFTAPLWTFLLTGIALINADLYLSSIFLGVLVTMVAAWLVAFRIGGSTTAMLLVLPPLLFSKAFVDFATAGLENPVTHLATALFLLVLFQTRHRPPARHLLLLTLATSMLLLNRMDTLLLVLPVLIFEYIRHKAWHSMGAVLAGAAPFIVWILFSTFYYGTPFPNTAYAKLNTGISGDLLLAQGGYYLLNSLALDPITLPLILAGVIMLFVWGGWRGGLMATGIVLYVSYTVHIGGDFMSGRFLAAPLFATVATAAAVLPARLERRHGMIFALAVAFPGTLNPLSPVLSGADYLRPFEQAVDGNGIADERAVFYWNLGLLRRHSSVPDHPWVDHARRASLDMENEPVLMHANIGLLGYHADPRLHILDVAALADPLLARLPSLSGQRVGHYLREVPPGYLETLRTGENRIIHPSLKKFHDALMLVVRAPLFSEGRLQEIWRLNTGYYDRMLDHYVSTRHGTVWPLTDLMVREALSQHVTGWWGFGNQGTIWAMGPDSHMLFDSNVARADTLSFTATSPFPTQRVEVSYNWNSLGVFEIAAADTLRVELPLDVRPGRNRLTFQFKRWNSEVDRYVDWTDAPSAMEFHQMGIR